MLRRIGVDTVGIEDLAKHQKCLAVGAGTAGFDWEVDIGCKRYIAGDLLPHKVKGIDRRPEISACSRNGIRTCGRVVYESSRRSNAADVGLALEDAHGF